jgi:hypothetical protein
MASKQGTIAFFDSISGCFNQQRNLSWVKTLEIVTMRRTVWQALHKVARNDSAISEPLSS